MPPKRHSTNPDYDALDYAYDVLDRLKDRHGPAIATETAWAMVQAGQDIEAGRAVVTKSAAGAVGIRYKAAPGMTTIEVPAELAAEITACRAQWGDAPFAQQLRQARGGEPSSGAKIADDEKAAAAFKSDTGRPLFRPVRDAQGRPLK